MADDVASLIIKVESLEAEQAGKRLSKLEKQGAKTERATDGLSNSFKRLAAPLAGIVSISAGLNKLFDVTKEVQNLNVQLQTATGSAEGAAEALRLIKRFAEETGQPVSEVSQAFVKLKNLGLDPSEKALMSYGNTAAAMGKNLDQLIEAVADAATGEFERLKEFGIKSRTEGENVSFTFQGMTTTVKKSAEEIEGYLQSLGESQFAGALDAKAKTLEGSINQLENSWNELFEVVSQQGSDEFMAEAFGVANDALKRFTQAIASGELEGHILALGGKFDGFAADIVNAFTVLEDLFRNEFQLFEDTGAGAADFIGQAFLDMPENIRAAIQLAVTEVAYMVDRIAIFGEEMAHDLNPKNWFGDSSEFDAAIQAQIDAANSARLTSIDTILAERDAKISNYEAEVEAVSKAAEAHAQLQAAKKGKGSLGQFSNKKNGSEGGEEEDSQSTFAEDFEILKLNLELEEAAIVESFVRRQQFLNKELKSKRIAQGKFDKETLKNQKLFLKTQEKAQVDSAKRSHAIREGYAQAGMTLMGAVFASSKKGSKALAGIKTIESAVSSYAAGARIGGPPLGAAFAAAAFAAQRATSSKIDGVSIGGGSVTGGGGGGSLDTPSLPDFDSSSSSNSDPFADDDATSTTGSVYVTINGVGAATQVEAIKEVLTDIFDSDDIAIPANSRQAQIIREG